MAANFGQHLEQFEPEMHPTVVQAIKRGKAISAVEFRNFEVIFTRAWHKLSPILTRCDALICPTESILASSGL